MPASPPNHSPVGDLPPRSGAERLITILWFLWVASLPLGRVTGLHNTLCVLVLMGTAWISRGSGWRAYPAKRILAPFVVWAGISYFWSAAPAVSAARWRSDLLLPVLSSIAAFVWSRRPGGQIPIFLGLALGLVLLGLCSAFDFLPPHRFEDVIPQADFGSVTRALPLWYPGVGDASMFAVLCLGPLLALIALSSRLPHSRRSSYQLGIVLLAGFVLAVSENRNAWLVLPLTLGAYLLAHGSARGDQGWVRRTKTYWIILGAVCVLVPIALESVTQMRLRQSHAPPVPWGQGVAITVEQDPRPQMWKAYFELGLAHPIRGVGYGRLVPGIAYETSQNEALLAIDPAARTHAHNLFLNLWLQLGVVGLGLFLSYFAKTFREAARRAHRSLEARLAFCGIAALLVAAALRDLTDDFLIFGIASAFWVTLGCLLGIQARSASGSTPRFVEARRGGPA